MSDTTLSVFGDHTADVWECVNRLIQLKKPEPGWTCESHYAEEIRQALHVDCKRLPIVEQVILCTSLACIDGRNAIASLAAGTKEPQRSVAQLLLAAKDDAAAIKRDSSAERKAIDAWLVQQEQILPKAIRSPAKGKGRG